jgi:zinc resistance-associated protein
MHRFAVLSSTALLILGFESAIAQQRSDSQDSMRPRLSAEDLGAFTDARVAALKAGLELTPDQAKNWPAFEQAYRDIAQLRRDRFMARRDQTSQSSDRSVADGLQRRADSVTRYGAALEDLAKAAKPLYQSLDDAQKRRFVMLAHLADRHHGHLATSRRGNGALGFNTPPGRNLGEQPH